MTKDEILNIVLGCGIDVHSAHEPGLLESACQQCLAFELEDKGLNVVREKAMPIVYKAQLLTYLPLGEYRLGLLLNFYVTILKNGIKRIIN